MKILKSILFLFVVFMLAYSAGAQEAKTFVAQQHLSKPKLFKELPDRINVNFKDFDDVFNYEMGRDVSLKFASNFVITGSVVSKSEDVMANVKTVVIRAHNRGGAALSLSRYINDDNTISYRGMFMSFKHDDAYEVTLENGSYYLVKKEASVLYEE